MLGTGARDALARSGGGAAAVTPRRSAAAAQLPGGRHALLYGGCECDKETGTSRVLGDLLLLDLATRTWTVLTPAKGAPVPGPRFKHTLCAVADGPQTAAAALWRL